MRILYINLDRKFYKNICACEVVSKCGNTSFCKTVKGI